MTEFSFISQFFVFLISFAGFSLGLWVYFANRKEKINRWFSLTTFFLILWAIFAYLGVSSLEVKKALLWFRLNWGAVSLAAISGYFFIVYFPKEEKRYWVLDKIILIMWLILSVISVFTNFIIKNVEIKEGGNEIIFGEGGNIFAIISAITLLIIVWQLFRKYIRLSKEEKLKVQYSFIGLALFVLFNIAFNVISPILFKTVKYQHLGDFSSIFLLGFTAYAIVKQELFGIRVIVTQALVGVIAIVLLAQAVTATNWLEFGWKFLIFLVFLYFGYLLIRSVLIEIKRRKELENLTSQLEVVNVKLTSAYKKLEILDEAKSEFISIASHQLRTPLSAIKGYLSMVLEKSYGKPPEKMKRPLENIYASNERLIKLVNDLLSISRIETGKIELEPEEASIEEIISGIIEELKIAAEKKNIYLRFEKPPKESKLPAGQTEKSLPKITIDKQKIREAIMNIIDNAIRYTEKGGVTIKCKAQDEKCKIEITDTGEGMTKEEISKLFESFSRGTAGTRFRTEGAGLGLYIAKKFVEMHKGRILVESKGKDKGSTFYIEIPIKQNL